MNYYIKILKRIAFILISLTSTANNTEQLPNGGFETWQDENNAEGWNSLSIEFLFFSIYFAEQTTDAASGEFAVKLETESVAGFTEVPGLISLGDFDLENLVPTGGIPFSGRPSALSFSYKYFPVNDDMMGSFLLLTRWNETTQKRDTIGGTIFSNPMKINDYERITLPIVYFSDLIPDTINVGFASSSILPQDGSTLFVDSVQLKYETLDPAPIALPASNIASSSFTANWVPFPLSDSLVFQLGKDANFLSMVENYEQVRVENIFPSPGEFRVENIMPGRYFYRLWWENENQPDDFSNSIEVSMPTRIVEPENISHEGFTAAWLPAHGALSYFLDVATDDEFMNPVSGHQMYPAGTFTSVEIDQLLPGTQYFYRVYVQYDEETLPVSEAVSITTAQTSEMYNICLDGNPENAGTLQGEGLFQVGTQVTIRAIPEENFKFLYWQNENTPETIESPEYSFVMPEEDICFTAHFGQDNATSVFQGNKNRHVKIYPVPAKDLIIFDANDMIIEKVLIYTDTGRSIKTLNPGTNTIHIDLTAYNPGYYIFQLKTEKGTFTKTIPIIGKVRK